MRNGESEMGGVMPSRAKHLNRENRSFASLRLTAFRIHNSAFDIH